MANRRSWASWFPIAAKPHNVGFRMSDDYTTWVENRKIGMAENAAVSSLAHDHELLVGLYLQAKKGA